MMCVVFYLFTFFGLFLPTDMLTSARNFRPANGQKYNLVADMAHHIHQDLDICPWTNLCKAQLEINNASRCSCIMLHHHSSAWPQPWSKVFLGNLTKDLAHSSSYPVHSLWKPEVADNDRNACVVFLPAPMCSWLLACVGVRASCSSEKGVAKLKWKPAILSIVANQNKLRWLRKSDGLSSSLVSLKSGWIP